MPRGAKGFKIKVGKAPKNARTTQVSSSSLSSSSSNSSSSDARLGKSVSNSSQSMEQTITKYCGTDWLSKLEQVTGSISFIDLPTYKAAIDKIVACEKNIKILLRRLLKQAMGDNLTQLTSLIDTFNSQSDSLNLSEKAIIRKLNREFRGKSVEPNEQNSHEDVSDDYTPIRIVGTDWFSTIKDIERSIYHIIEKVFISPDGEAKNPKTSKARKQLKNDFTYEEYTKVARKYPAIRDLYTFHSVHISNENVFNTLLDLQKHASIIINQLLTPMYNVKEKIEKSYDKHLASAFKPMVANGTVTRDLVINLLTDFMIAKYRSNITGSQKYFLQMLSNELTEGMLAHCNASEFVSIMDTIKLEEMDSKSKALDFTIKAKEIMKRMVDRDSADEAFGMEMIKDVKDLLGGEDETETMKKAEVILKELPGEIQQHLAKFDDILAIDDEKDDEKDEKKNKDEKNEKGDDEKETDGRKIVKNSKNSEAIIQQCLKNLEGKDIINEGIAGEVLKGISIEPTEGGLRMRIETGNLNLNESEDKSEDKSEDNANEDENDENNEK